MCGKSAAASTIAPHRAGPRPRSRSRSTAPVLRPTPAPTPAAAGHRTGTRLLSRAPAPARDDDISRDGLLYDGHRDTELACHLLATQDIADNGLGRRAESRRGEDAHRVALARRELADQRF